MNKARLYGWGNMAMHWFGLVCPECGGQIPCLLSLPSRAVLLLFHPIVQLFGQGIRRRYLAWEIHRLERMRSRLSPLPPDNWGRIGIITGIGMSFVMLLAFIFLLSPPFYFLDIHSFTENRLLLFFGMVGSILIGIGMGVYQYKWGMQMNRELPLKPDDDTSIKADRPQNITTKIPPTQSSSK